jgi:hypothetical protein
MELMRETTGVAHLDVLLAAFAETHPEYRAPSGAGPCVEASEQLAALAEQAAVPSRYFEAGCKPNPLAPSLPHFGYRESELWAGHTALILDDHTGAFLVDFTAAAFGYTAFPLVQKLAADGTWQRDWQAA